MATLREVRELLIVAARRYSRVRHEAEDLAHDLIVAALRRRLRLEDDGFTRAANASARRHGAFTARSAARRRARESFYALEAGSWQSDEPITTEVVASRPLPAALHTTLLLLILGHTRSELRSALGLTDVALRKRLQGLRARAPIARPVLAKPLSSSPLELRRAQVRLAPRLAALLQATGSSGRLVAVSDGDGHGIIFSEVLTNGPGTATTGASSPDSRGHETFVKGQPC